MLISDLFVYTRTPRVLWKLLGVEHWCFYETKLTPKYYYKTISVNQLRKLKSYLKIESVMYIEETVSSFSLVGAINKSNERVATLHDNSF